MNKQKEIDKYILNHIDEEDDILRELDRETHLNVLGARMISGHLQGQVLTMLSKMIQPECILEIGTFTGYSAICLAKGLREGGKLITIEIDDELENIAKKYFVKAGLQHQIVQRIGPALEIIPTLNETFDLVFIVEDDYHTRGIIEFNNIIKNDKRVEKVILPLRDGMTIIRKK